MDSATHHHAASGGGLKRGDHEGSHGRKDQRGVQASRAVVRPFRRPDGAKFARESLRRGIPAACEGIHPPTFGRGDLGDNVRGRAETVNAQVFCIVPASR